MKYYYKSKSKSIIIELKRSFLTKLGLDCNLGKDLRNNERDDQLVKCKDIELHLLLYIRIPLLLYEALTYTIWGKHIS